MDELYRTERLQKVSVKRNLTMIKLKLQNCFEYREGGDRERGELETQKKSRLKRERPRTKRFSFFSNFLKNRLGWVHHNKKVKRPIKFTARRV